MTIKLHYKYYKPSIISLLTDFLYSLWVFCRYRMVAIDNEHTL